MRVHNFFLLNLYVFIYTYICTIKGCNGPPLFEGWARRENELCVHICLYMSVCNRGLQRANVFLRDGLAEMTDGVRCIAADASCIGANAAQVCMDACIDACMCVCGYACVCACTHACV